MDLNSSKIPKKMSAGPITLVFDNIITPESKGELVPYYHFKIRIQTKDLENKIVGHINFRVGETKHIKLVAGHVGYGVLPEFRGNNYSYGLIE